MPAELVTVPGVPICGTGTFWLSSGKETFTEEDLQAAVAALNDPAVKVPRVKIDGLAASFDPAAHGGEPAFGRVENMRISADGQTLVGDFMVPQWLADSMEWAYPSRSIEGGKGWRSPTGKTHELVITAVALLGVDLPGVSVLPDLQELLSAEGPTMTPREVVARVAGRPRDIAASLDADIVGRRFYDQLDVRDIALPPEITSPETLWIRSMRFDDDGTPYLKIEDDGTGRLYRVGFTVAGSDVTFGDLSEIAEIDKPVVAGESRLRTLCAWASRSLSRSALTTATASAAPEPKKENDMDDKVREFLVAQGIAPEQATEDQINAASVFVAAGMEPPAEAPVVEAPVAAAPEAEAVAPAEETPAAVAEPEPIAAAALSDVARLSAQVAEMQARDAQREQDAAAARRDQRITAAVTDGRIAPAQQGHYRRLLDVDEAAAGDLLDALAAGSVPLTARGEHRDETIAATDMKLSDAPTLNQRQRESLTARGL